MWCSGVRECVGRACGRPVSRRCDRRASMREQLAEHLFGVEVLTRDLRCRDGVPSIAAFDLVECRDGVVPRHEREQARPDRQASPEARVLSDDWPTGREIRSASVAEPTTPEADVLVFGNRELTSRALDVSPVHVEIDGDRGRVDDLPTESFKASDGVRGALAERELERLVGVTREVGELLELK